MNNDKNPSPSRVEDALADAVRVQRDAAALGFDWPDAAGVLAKIDEEAGEIRDALARGDVAQARAELGDLLFSTVNLSRFLSVCPDEALRATTAKFERRFAEVKRRVGAAGRMMSECALDDLDAHWDAVKEAEKESGDGLDRGPGRGAHWPPPNR